VNLLFCFVFVLIIINKEKMDWAARARAQACRAASPPMGVSQLKHVAKLP
jgi:hypothetical protein